MTFRETKDWFAEFYVNLANLCLDVNEDYPKDNEILKKLLLDIINTNCQTSAIDLSTILKIIERKNMKCVFFGKTSNGKSATINSLLRYNLLPSSKGRTTSCFVNIEGCSEETGYIMNSENQKGNISLLHDLANEQNPEGSTIETIIRVYWSKSRCELLAKDVEIMDSPGVDYTTENDSWIDKYCEDADVFVLVLDCTGTLSQSERDFFLKIKKKLCTPNIIVLVNKWDLTRDDPDNATQKLKEQCISTVTKFLRNDLQLYQNANISERLFFVSSREALKDMVLRDPSFNDFETYLIQQMSENALRTKFGLYSERGARILDGLRDKISACLQKLENTMEMEKENIDYLKISVNDMIKEQFDSISSATKELVTKNTTKLIQQLEKAVETESDLDFTVVNFLEKQFPEELSKIFSQSIQKLSDRLSDKLAEIFSYKISADEMKTIFEYDRELQKLAEKYKDSIGINLQDSSNTVRSLFKNKEERILFWRNFLTKIRTVTRVLTIPAFMVTRIYRPLIVIPGIVSLAAELIPLPNNKYIPKEILQEFINFYNSLTEYFINETRNDVTAKIDCSLDLFVRYMKQAKETEKKWQQLKIQCKNLHDQIERKTEELTNYVL